MDLHDFQLWGGVECTVNRVGERFFEQLSRTGHIHRLDDIDSFAELGLRVLRTPVLWERVAPHHPDECDFEWSDAAIDRTLARGMSPIIGLLHHGSGPLYTDLLDPAFAPKMARYARHIAERYPSVEMYTPVNEPLTTARFSALYGHWYPHHTDPRSFLTALLNQCRGVVLAMEQVRAVNPAARLVQTEDIGSISSTAPLAYQAEFENIRKWLTYDLLFGRVDRTHRMWQFITWLGIPEDTLEFFLEHPCPPDIIGMNHYVTSNRFLDHRLNLYPPQMWGGNGRDRYVDIEWIRLEGSPSFTLHHHLIEAWQRYKTPIVITESHLGCDCALERAAWLGECLAAAHNARLQGVHVPAITLWALLGAFDWSSLITQESGVYEAGLFDVSSGAPVETQNVARIRELTRTGRIADPILQAFKGWWRRPERVLYPADESMDLNRDIERRPNSMPLLTP